LQQKKSSKAERVRVSFTKKFALTKPFAEKYLKKLMGLNDIEDALKRLERLTQEEARMAAAQLLKVTNAIDNRVGGIADNMLIVENRVAGIDDRVAGVDERVAGVNERVAGVNDRVACVDNRVAGIGDQVQGVDDTVTAVMDGARYIFYLLSWNCLTHSASRWKRGVANFPTSS
jgi:archaellum component FlaC